MSSHECVLGESESIYAWCFDAIAILGIRGYMCYPGMHLDIRGLYDYCSMRGIFVDGDDRSSSPHSSTAQECGDG